MKAGKGKGTTRIVGKMNVANTMGSPKTPVVGGPGGASYKNFPAVKSAGIKEAGKTTV
jgi:hypothetical protein